MASSLPPMTRIDLRMRRGPDSAVALMLMAGAWMIQCGGGIHRRRGLQLGKDGLGIMKGRTPGQEGQGLVEYAMILVFAVIALVGVLTVFGLTIESALYMPVVDAFAGFFS